MAENVMERFHALWAQNKQKEAAELIKSILDENAKLERQLTDEKAKFERQLMDEMAKLERQLTNESTKLKRQLTDSNTLLEIARKQVDDFHLERAADERAKEGKLPSQEVTIFTHAELAAATKDFDVSYKMGEGTSGSVYKGFLRHTDVAIKKLHPESSRGQDRDREFKQEVATLGKVRHPHLISLIGASPEDRALVYDYLPNGNLETYLISRKNNKVPWQDRLRMASEICSALIFLHSQSFAHGNLKPENVLLDSNLACKVSDFGLSRKLESSKDTMTPAYMTGRPQGSLAYIDPEYLAFGELTPQSDVFAYGIILMQFVTGRDPRGLRSVVEKAVETGKVDKIADHSAGKWPVKEATKLAQLGLDCSHQMRKRRPKLAEDVWPKINLMREAASASNSK